MNRTFDPGLGLSVICDLLNTGGNVWAAIKAPVKAATTANISLTGRQTIDGVALIDGDRVLVKDQTLGYQNGIYLVSTFGSWGRAPDWDDNFDVLNRTLVPVAAGGTTNGGTHYAVTTSDPITVGTTNVSLAIAFSAASSSFTPSGTGPASEDLQSKIRRDVAQSPEDRGCVGDGTTDDTTNFGVFLDNASNKINILTGTYLLTSILAKEVSNAVFIGVPGKTKITGSFDYAVLKFLALSNVQFYGITFESTYTNATQDGSKGVVYSLQTNVANVVFSHCKFTAPNANTNGLAVYARTTAGDTSATIDGLWIQDCEFSSLGRMGCILMNRGTAADKYTAAQRVYFIRNKCSSLGLGGNNGMAISLDGFGSSFSVDDNYINAALVSGIENAGWVEGSISRNKFDGFSTSYQPISISSSTQMYGLHIEGNRTLSACGTTMTLYNFDKSKVIGNYFELNVGITAVANFRDCNDNTFIGNTWLNSLAASGKFAVFMESSLTTCKRNRFYGDTFDTSASGAQTSAVRFSGASCSENVLMQCVVAKGTGGSNFDEVSSAANNLALRCIDNTANIVGFNRVAQNFSSDADMTLTVATYSADIIKINDTGVLLTTGRNVLLPAQQRQWTVLNNTAQTLTFKISGGSGIAVATTKTAIIYTDGATTFRATADT